MRIGSIVITFNPDESLFPKVFDSLINQVDELCIIDNGSNNNCFINTFSNDNKKCKLFELNENMGIAFATNKGLSYFKEKNFDYVVVSDQDSVFPNNYIKELKVNIEKFKNEYSNIAAFCPTFYDENRKAISPIYKWNNNYMYKTDMVDDTTEVFQAIASGLCINIKLLDLVGLMNEDLFIDWVDFEWCWKVQYNKKKIICCKNLQITHKLGDYSKGFGKRNVSMHSYVRNYYITRNAFYLALNTKYLPFISRIILFFQSFKYILGYTILAENHIKNFKFTNKGFFDAIIGKMGKLR